ncbi:YajG family lipoprotein [Entomomonas sp. E2T0]|uniref:YajG family lipoprotein n=1 Tax=Entomomonas sp. E2T0 TaxID=2930213 RepID=UPI0022283060|nr:YajG family lipoprotein [Entomomonas sp. E2T0]UYZ85211.1 YajG family lipoprotein [Entomomonas sp. E2T0]
MIFRQGLLVCLMSVGLLTGCALSPQQLTPNPIITQALPQVGHGQTVNVKVTDSRSTEIIGTRGGLYASTSNINLQANDIVPKLQQQAEQALTNMGYKPQTGGDITLNIIIDSITYQATDSSLANGADIKAVLRSQLQTPSKTYNGRYTSSVSQSFASAPSLETNNKLVAEVLTNALTSLFKDSHLTDAM